MNRKNIAYLFVVLVIVLIFGFMAPLGVARVWAQSTYTLTIVSTAGGTVTTPGEGNFNYAAGTAVSLAAKPATGYHFLNWVGDVGTVANNNSTSTTITMNGNYTIAANFDIDTFIIIATAGANGSISPSPGTTTVAYGHSQIFTITPKTGYRIADVLVDGSSVGAVGSYTFTNVTSDHTISATFEVNDCTITPTAGTNGLISPSDDTIVAYDGNQTFTITPNTGYRIANVWVDGSSVGAVSSYTFTNVTSHHTISAAFAPDAYTITTIVGANGSISPSGATTVAYDDSQTFTITPNTGYRIADVLVDGSSVGAVSSYTFTNVTSHHTISATFAPDAYTITANVGANGSISPFGNTTVTHGGSQTFTITPNTGYRIADVLVDGSWVGAMPSYTFSNITATHTIVAIFAFSWPIHTLFGVCAMLFLLVGFWFGIKRGAFK